MNVFTLSSGWRWYTWQKFNTSHEFYIFYILTQNCFHDTQEKLKCHGNLALKIHCVEHTSTLPFMTMVYKLQFTNLLRNIYLFRGAAEKCNPLIACASTHYTNLWKTITHTFAFGRLYVLQYVPVVQLRGLNLPFIWWWNNVRDIPCERYGCMEMVSLNVFLQRQQGKFMAETLRKINKQF
jgi:hypothetical protein